MAVLISPLGRSPGAVSGVYFALLENGFSIDRVVTLGTSHPVVLQAARNYLAPLFAELNVSYDPIHLQEKDITHEKRVIMPYASLMGLEIDRARKAGETVHVAVTGGRSGMGALAALAAQFYGAHHLWHLWVPAEIEGNGDAEQLAGLISTADLLGSVVLNPTLAGREAYDLVPLPFMDLSELQTLLKTYAETGTLPDAASVVMQAILKDSGLSRNLLRQVYPAGVTFEAMDEYFELVNRYRGSPDYQVKEQTLIDIGSWMQRSGIVDGQDREKLQIVLRANGSADELRRLVKKDRTGFWAFLERNKDKLGLIKSAIDLLLKIGELYLKFKNPVP